MKIYSDIVEIPTLSGGGVTGFTGAESTDSPNNTVYADSLTASAASTNADACFIPKGTGAILAQIPDSTATGGNKRGTYAVDLQRVRNAATQVASGAQATISGGGRNTASGLYNTVSGGYNSTASGDYATVSGGLTNSAAAYGTVGGGTANAASGGYSTIAGGFTGTASTTACTIGGGSSNTASGAYATVSGGYVNTASGAHAVVSGGDTNTASGSVGTVSGGKSNSATGTYSWIPGGFNAVTRGLTGAYAYSSSARAAQGDAQVIGQPVRRTTSDATPVSLSTGGAAPAATTVMVIPDGAVMMCRAMGVAKTPTITDSIGFVVEASVCRTGSTTTLLSTPVTTIHGANGLALNATIVVDNTTNESVEIQVTGAAATTIYWVGELHCVQVL